MSARAISILAAGLVLALAAPAAADEVVLKDGEKVQGVVVDEGDRISVRLDYGTVSFDRADVAEVKRSAHPLEELEQKKKALAPNDAAGRRSLAAWAEQRGLMTAARDLYREVLAIDPNDETARRALGFRKVEGVWKTEEEYYQDKGMLRFDGRWITREEMASIDADRARRREEAEARELRDRAAREAAAYAAAPREPAREAPETVDMYGGWALSSSGWMAPYVYPLMPAPAMFPGFVAPPLFAFELDLFRRLGANQVSVGVRFGDAPELVGITRPSRVAPKPAPPRRHPSPPAAPRRSGRGAVGR